MFHQQPLLANVSSAALCSSLNQGLMDFTLSKFKQIEDVVYQQQLPYLFKRMFLLRVLSDDFNMITVNSHVNFNCTILFHASCQVIMECSTLTQTSTARPTL
jgi:hypothetical protein